jgi:glycosyltransferase involved in cell wall biosynthesis
VHVLIAIHGFPPTHYGGAERAAERIARWLVQQGHHTEIFTVEDPDSDESRIETQTMENGLVIHRLHYNIKAPAPTLENTYNHPYVGEALRKILQSGSFDVLHLISGYLLGAQVVSAAREFGIPLVVTLTEYWFMCARLNLIQTDNRLCSGPESDDKCVLCLMQEKRRYRLMNSITPGILDTIWSITQNTSFADVKLREITERRVVLQKALESADLVICPSRYIQNKFQEYGYDLEKAVFIQHGVGQSSGPLPSSAPSDVLRLGYMGQIKPHKGIDLLVQAVVNLLNAKEQVSLQIWGSTDDSLNYATRLLRQTKKYPSVHWGGHYTASQLNEVLSSFDVLVVPSRWYENMPTVILEAFKAGKPVIATRLGGMAELIEHEKSGLLFELNDADDLQKQVERILHDRSLLTRFQTGIPSVKSADEEVEAIFSHYRRLTEMSDRKLRCT